MGTPMTLTVHLSNDLERRLRERASCDGRSVEDYVLELIERDAVGTGPGPINEASNVRPGRDKTLSDAEFELLLDGLASGSELPQLPADFSRADIYADHD
jgi:plasmid stability protein